MAIDRELIDRILKAADIVAVISSYIPVIKKGRNYEAICPFHDDTNPSLKISVDKQIFRCFVCGTGGNAITFVEKYEKISFIEALRKVANMVGIKDPRLEEQKKYIYVDESKEPLFKALEDLTSYYHYALKTEEGSKALKYLENRGLFEGLRKEYQLGYAFLDGKNTIKYLTSKGHSLKTIEEIGIATHNNGVYSDRNYGRVIFPLHNIEGRVVGFSARRLDDSSDEAKYVNSPETVLFHKSDVLFNYHIAKRVARHEGYVYLLEGFMDVFALRKIGIESCVAIMGTSLTKRHISLLRALGCEVRLCLDGDNAGQTATMRIIKMLDEAEINYRIVSNQNSTRDPDEILAQDGEQGLRAYLNKLLNRAEFALSYYKQTNSLRTLEERKQLIFDFIPILLHTKSRLELEDYFLSLASATSFPIEEIRNLFNKAKSQKEENPVEIYKAFKPERKELRRFFLAEKEILYQMLNHKDAIEFYKNEIEFFYNEVYRNVANFIIDYYMKYSSVDLVSMLSELDLSEYPNKDELIKELTEVSLEKTHPEYSLELMEECKNTIISERTKLFKKEQLKSALEGLSPLEQAAYLAALKKKGSN